jgi:hypothetical protein
MVESNALNSMLRLVDKLNPLFKSQYNIEIDLNAIVDYKCAVDEMMDNDIDSIRAINKASSMWTSYLSDIYGIAFLICDSYKNVRDVYSYLDSISIKNSEQFQLEAPKYKIPSDDLSSAIIILKQKTDDVTNIIKDFKSFLSYIEGYMKLTQAVYYKTSKMIRQNEFRVINTSFAI